MTTVRRATRDELAACLAIRRTVFIEEQSVPEHEEVDGLDDICLHYVATLDGPPIATARVLPQDHIAKIQRVAVLGPHRGTGLGRALMLGILKDLRRNHSFATAKLGSQTHAIGFYESLGFIAIGPEFDDAGIPHRDMLRDL